MTTDTANQQPYKTVLIFGPPGSGKGTWGKILGMMPGFYHFATGDMFRTLDYESEIGARVMKIMRQGDLVPDDLTFDLWSRHMELWALIGTFKPRSDVLILDGFPRTPTQAEMLDGVAELKAILLLDCPDRDVLIERLHKRAVLEHRADDASETTIRNRFERYDEETSSTIAHFPQDLIEYIDVSRAPIEILAKISSSLSKHL